MKLISGVILLCSSLWMFIYLYGLDQISSSMFSPFFYFLCVIQLLASLYCLIKYYDEEKNPESK